MNFICRSIELINQYFSALDFYMVNYRWTFFTETPKTGKTSMAVTGKIEFCQAKAVKESQESGLDHSVGYSRGLPTLASLGW